MSVQCLECSSLKSGCRKSFGKVSLKPSVQLHTPLRVDVWCDLQNIRCLSVGSSESALGGRRQPEEDLLAVQKNPRGWGCSKDKSREGRQTCLVRKALKALFLPPSVFILASNASENTHLGWRHWILPAGGKQKSELCLWLEQKDTWSRGKDKTIYGNVVCVCLPTTGY